MLFQSRLKSKVTQWGFFSIQNTFFQLWCMETKYILNWFLIILNIHACMIASKTRISTTNCFWNIHFIMCHSVLNQKPISNYVSLWNNNFLMHHCSIPCIYREFQVKLNMFSCINIHFIMYLQSINIDAANCNGNILEN